MHHIFHMIAETHELDKPSVTASFHARPDPCL